MFRKNLNLSGRLMRLALAIILLIYAIWAHSWLVFGVSLFVFFEAFMSWCILYQLFGINECPIESQKHDNENSDSRK